MRDRHLRGASRVGTEAGEIAKELRRLQSGSGHNLITFAMRGGPLREDSPDYGATVIGNTDVDRQRVAAPVYFKVEG